MYFTHVPMGRKVMYLTLHPAPFPRGSIPGGDLSTIHCAPLNAPPLSLHPPGVAPLLPGTGESRVRGDLRGMLGAASVPPPEPCSAAPGPRGGDADRAGGAQRGRKSQRGRRFARSAQREAQPRPPLCALLRGAGGPGGSGSGSLHREGTEESLVQE